MRWFTFLILLYFFTALQTSHLGGIPSKDGLWPTIEFLPMLAIFYALYAVDASAPLAALVCGLAYDLRSGTFIGTNLIPLALVGWLIVRIRLSIFREHFISQLIITLLGVLAFALLSALFRRLIGAPLQRNAMAAHLGYLAGNAVYTALIAPLLFHALFRFHALLGFTQQGPRSRTGR
jgi:rod shape-determining protein MreD